MGDIGQVLAQFGGLKTLGLILIGALFIYAIVGGSKKQSNNSSSSSTIPPDNTNSGGS